MSLPRFLFLAMASPGAGAARAGVEFHWRLVGGNNHVLGRCPVAYRELELCQGAVVRLAAGIEDFSATVALANRPGGWTWQLTGPGPVDDLGVEVSAEAATSVDHVLAMSARSFERQRECRVSFEKFVTAAPAAVVVGKVTVRPRTREVTRLRPLVPSSRVSPESARRGIRLR